MSGPDELLARIDRWIDNCGWADRPGTTVDIIRDCRAHIAANAALAADQNVMQDDLAALLRALDMSDSARSESPHTVMLQAIERVAALAARCGEMQAAIDELFALDLYNTPVGKRMTKESEQRRLDYAKRWPLAWKTIRALASQAAGETK